MHLFDALIRGVEPQTNSKAFLHRVTLASLANNSEFYFVSRARKVNKERVLDDKVGLVCDFYGEHVPYCLCHLLALILHDGI